MSFRLKPTVFLLFALFTGLSACQRGKNVAEAAREERSLNPNGTNPGKMIPEAGENSLSAEDRDIASQIESSTRADLDLGTYVQERAKDKDVKEFATTVVDDHSQALSEIRTFLKQHGVNEPVAEAPKEELSEITALRNTPDNEVGRNYVGMMVLENQRNLDELKADAAKVQNPDLKKYIQNRITVIDDHTRKAESLESKLNKNEKG